MNNTKGTINISHYLKLLFRAQALAGSFAGALSVLVTNPLDVVKTRLQTQGTEIQQVKKTFSVYNSNKKKSIIQM